jgi:glycosyltransferase involved in cell wall biosynthesis
MKTINILTENYSWILRRAAREICQIKEFKFEINGQIGSSDLDYYFPYLLYKKQKSKKTIGFFTHMESSNDPTMREKRRRFREFPVFFDHCVAISKQTADLILDVDKTVIQMGSQFKKKIKFGVCGRVHKSGRKNENFVAELVRLGFDVSAWGEGWPCQIKSSDPKDLESFYSSIDYLIIPSSIEGGPMPVLESLSLGVPVIAPNIGWCWDFPVIKYERDDFQSLLSVVRGLSSIRTWDDWRKDHGVLFSKILGL